MKTRSLKLSINTSIFNKGYPSAKGWVNVDFTINDLLAHVSRGFAYCCQLRDGYRRSSNFLAMDVASVDIDEGLTWRQALEHPYISRYASLIYTTCSHTADKPKLRVVFVLPRTITSADEMASIYRALAAKVGGDTKATDAARLFFGSHRCQSETFDGQLDEAELESLLTTVDKRQTGGLAKPLLLGQHFLPEPAQATQVTTARGHLVTLADLPAGTSIHCPVHNDKHPSAFVVTSRAGALGVHCHTCKQTFWDATTPPSFNFHRFDEYAHCLTEGLPLKNAFVMNCLSKVYGNTPTATVISKRHLEGLPRDEGILLVKSPKGSGKTYSLARFVNAEKRSRRNVLLISHRRLLIDQMCNTLGLASYQNHKTPSTSSPKHFAVCLDSLSKHLRQSKTKYHSVIIDECEQVFHHLCSGTIQPEQRTALLMRVIDLINNARRVILLDADIGDVTLDAITGRYNERKHPKNIKLLLNTARGDAGIIDIFQSRAHLLAALIDAVGNGKRCFVTSNSKERVNKLYSDLTKRFPDKKFLRLTSEDTSSDEARLFLNDINRKILEYSAVVCTPVLGTGTDISVNGDEKVDCVFGIFEAGINTHLDIDQQLGRVRHPGSIAIFISKRTFNDSHDYEEVVTSLVDSEAVPEALLKIVDGQVCADRNHPTLRLLARSLSVRHASGNNVYQHFVDHKKRSGWTINVVEKDKHKAAIGNLFERKMTEDYKQSEIDSILQAPTIDDQEYERLRKGRRLKKLNELDRYKLVRSEIEREYGQSITRELISLDNCGRFRVALRLYEKVTDKIFCDAASAARPGNVVDFPSESMLWRRNVVMLLRELYQAAGILKGYQFDRGIEIQLADLKIFSEMCLNRKASLLQLLGFRVRSDVGENPVRHLNDLLRLVGLKLLKVRTKRLSSGGKGYLYRLDSSSITDMEKYAKRLSLKRKRASPVYSELRWAG